MLLDYRTKTSLSGEVLELRAFEAFPAAFVQREIIFGTEFCVPACSTDVRSELALFALRHPHKGTLFRFGFMDADVGRVTFTTAHLQVT
jgi:hypothetical protein